MQAPIAQNATLADAIIPRRNLLLDVALIVGYAALTGLSAQIAVYINPAVPITGRLLPFCYQEQCWEAREALPACWFTWGPVLWACRSSLQREQ